MAWSRPETRYWTGFEVAVVCAMCMHCALCKHGTWKGQLILSLSDRFYRLLILADIAQSPRSEVNAATQRYTILKKNSVPIENSEPFGFIFFIFIMICL